MRYLAKCKAISNLTSKKETIVNFLGKLHRNLAVGSPLLTTVWLISNLRAQRKQTVERQLLFLSDGMNFWEATMCRLTYQWKCAKMSIHHFKLNAVQHSVKTLLACISSLCLVMKKKMTDSLYLPHFFFFCCIFCF